MLILCKAQSVGIARNAAAQRWSKFICKENQSGCNLHLCRVREFADPPCPTRRGGQLPDARTLGLNHPSTGNGMPPVWTQSTKLHSPSEVSEKPIFLFLDFLLPIPSHVFDTHYPFVGGNPFLLSIFEKMIGETVSRCDYVCLSHLEPTFSNHSHHLHPTHPYFLYALPPIFFDPNPKRPPQSVLKLLAEKAKKISSPNWRKA